MPRPREQREEQRHVTTECEVGADALEVVALPLRHARNTGESSFVLEPSLDTLAHLDAILGLAWQIETDEWLGRRHVDALAIEIAIGR